MASIYLIEDCDGLKYIGSTKNKLSKRLSGHKADKTRNRNGSSSKLNLELCFITELEKCNEENRKVREQYWIDNTECVNRRNTVHDEKHYIKEYMKQYREKNKDKVHKINKEWSEKNKEKIKANGQNRWIEKVVKNCLDDLIKQVEDLN